ncbi:MAG: formylglycine-generating enzyme family protein [Candidatus Nitrohelix vancouverensis]|uniref:Formylglycine-generating enzyme family protein n=1 Tax=Candidatus Nitrohelix vancouverensis TaxID=2705534 RepID=A0A7T0BZQ6_9BACT|nr:MAG: formylglycine-generating enzyme family protein [Candidatus Nitrohelix vancouverensis]
MRWIFIILFLALLAPVGAMGQGAPDMALVKGAELTINKSGTRVTRKVAPFFIDRYEVTQEDYEAQVGRNPAFFKGPRRPVEKVTWAEARDYCRALGKVLPTEWQWELAARAGSQTLFFWGDDWDGRYAWGKENADKKTHPVASARPNALGLYDMLGNVGEWMADDHELAGKVIRGGSWRNGPRGLETAHRIMEAPRRKFHYVGFRCAKPATQAEPARN